MKKLLPVVFCGLAAISFSTLTLAGADAATDAGTKANAGAGASACAGPTDNPNVTRDAQGREHANKGKHNGQARN
jgi:hypothetical protein